MHIGYKDYAHFVDSHKFWFPDAFEESEEEEEEYPELTGDWSTPTPLVSICENQDGEAIDIIAQVGSWYVSTKGDLFFNRDNGGVQSIRNLKYYAIYSYQLQHADWVLHLSKKVWFTKSCYEDFKRAYYVACSIAKVSPAKQINTYKHQ